LSRAAPALLLFFLSPLIAEYLLGDLGLDQLGAFIPLAPFYGGAAILVREAVRRSGRGWRAFVLLALAYAIFEEGIVTQSLFNPDYLHLRLIDYGFLPAVGTALPWALYVLGIHIIWSLAVPIGLAEAAFPARRTEPWLNGLGFALTAILFVAGAAMVAGFSWGDTAFRASAGQLAACLVLIALLPVLALLLPKASVETAGKPASPWLIGLAALAGGSAFLGAYALGQHRLAWPATVAIDAAVAAALLLFFSWAARRDWTAVQTWAAATGGMLCYGWFGYFIDRSMHPPSGTPGHSLFVVVSLGVALWAGARTRRLSHPVSAA
jgi:hypothetical protein